MTDRKPSDLSGDEHRSAPQHRWDKSGRLWKRDNPERTSREDEAEGSQATGSKEDYSGAMGDAGSQRR